MIDLEKFPKAYDIDPEQWQSEGEWRKHMTLIYTGKARIKNQEKNVKPGECSG